MRAPALPIRASGSWAAAAAACGAGPVWSTNALAAGAALEQLTLAQVLALQFGGGATVIALARSASRSARPGTEGVRRHVMTSRARRSLAGRQSARKRSIAFTSGT
jgi:hypothetical protein